MNKVWFTMKIAVFTLLLCAISYSISSAQSSTSTPNPTSSSTLFSLIPGWQNITPDVSDWNHAKEDFIAQNYEIEAPIPSTVNSQIQDYGVSISKMTPQTDPSTYKTDVNATVGVLPNDKIAYINMSWYIGNPMHHLTDQEWITPDPARLIQLYGAPSDFYLSVADTDGGPRGSAIIQWKNAGILAIYASIKIPENNYDTYAICFAGENVKEVNLIWVAPNGSYQSSIDPQYYRVPEQSLSPRVIRGVDSLTQLGEILQRRECLQSPVLTWVSISDGASTLVPAPTFTPTVVIPTATNTDTPTSTNTPTPTLTSMPSVDDLRTKLGICVTDKGLLNSLTVKLNAGQFGAFINEVNAQSGKKIDQQCATDLITLASYLRDNPTATPTRTPSKTPKP